MSMKTWSKCLLLLGPLVFGVVFLMAMPASAQLPTGTILGIVKDATGGTVAGADVTVTNTDTNLTRTGTTTDDGAYRFPALPVGHYQVRVMKEGFQTAERTGLTLEVGEEASIDVALQVGSTGQTITVTGEAPLVNTTSSSGGGVVSEEKVEDLPLNGRNYIDLTLLQPGVTQTNITTGPYGMNGTFFSSNGASLRSNNSMLDGAITTTLMGLTSGSIISTTLGIDGIKEYKVVTILPSAEYGLTMGSQTTIVSKGGTNQWHGDVFEYLRNSSLDARNYFQATDITNHNDCGTDKSLNFPCKRIAPFQRNNFGASFGGPIRKDKTFVFGVYEGLRQSLAPAITTTTFNKGCFVDATGKLQPTLPASIDNNVSGSTINGVPPNPFLTTIKGVNTACTTPSGTPQTNVLINVNPIIAQLDQWFPQPNVFWPSGVSPPFNYTFPFKQPSTENYAQLRMDQNISNSDSAFARYTADLSTQYNNEPYSNWKPHYRSESLIATASENHIFSPTVLNTARFSFSRTGLEMEFPTVPFLAQDVFIVGSYDAGSISPGSGVTGGGGGGGDTPGHIYQNIWTGSDDLFWTKGKHAFKFGTLINRFTGVYALLFTENGSASFSNNANFFAGDYSSLSGLGPNSDQTRIYNWWTLGFYAQDDYRVLSRLTLNLGLRYEIQTTLSTPSGETLYNVQNILTSTSGTPGTLYLNPSLHNFSPRVGFALDVFGDGKTSLRGGAGIFYDIANPGSQIAGNGSGDPTLSKLIGVQNAGATPPAACPFQVRPFTLQLPSCLTSGLITSTARVADYHPRQPSMAQWNLAIDRQLPAGIALTIAYVGSKGWHIWQTTEGNPEIPVGYLPNGLPYYCTIVNPALGTCANSNFQPRTNPAFGPAQYYTTAADVYYHGLQTSLNTRLYHGLQAQVAYTFSKDLDDSEKMNGDSSSGPQSGEAPQQSFQDKGRAAFDVRHNAHANVIYHAPDIKSDRFYVKPFQGWWFGTIVTLQSGLPINPADGTDRSLQNAQNETTRPNLDASYNPATVITGDPQQWFNPTMFDLEPAGQLGNAAREILPGPDLINVDFSINKDTKLRWLGESGAVQFRGEIFNIFNHPQFLAPSGNMWAGASSVGTAPSGQFGSAGGPAILQTAGVITATSHISREIQLALKIVF